MASITERYSIARNTSNLKSDRSDTPTRASDVIAAAGMAAQEHEAALMLWDVTVRGKTSAKLALVHLLEGKLTDHMIRHRIKGDPRRIAMEVTAWHLHGVCNPCSGRGYEVASGTPSLTGRACPVCNGSGKVHISREPAYLWLMDYMNKLVSIAGGQVMRKRANDVEL